MSRMLDRGDYCQGDFELGERVSFMHGGERLYGEIARVYNTRTLYHVEVDGRRYEAQPGADNMRRE
jgi:hypothetical protein